MATRLIPSRPNLVRLEQCILKYSNVSKTVTKTISITLYDTNWVSKSPAYLDITCSNGIITTTLRGNIMSNTGYLNGECSGHGVAHVNADRFA